MHHDWSMTYMSRVTECSISRNSVSVILIYPRNYRGFRPLWSTLHEALTQPIFLLFGQILWNFIQSRARRSHLRKMRICFLSSKLTGVQWPLALEFSKCPPPFFEVEGPKGPNNFRTSYIYLQVRPPSSFEPCVSKIAKTVFRNICKGIFGKKYSQQFRNLRKKMRKKIFMLSQHLRKEFQAEREPSLCSSDLVQIQSTITKIKVWNTVYKTYNVLLAIFYFLQYKILFQDQADQVIQPCQCEGIRNTKLAYEVLASAFKVSTTLFPLVYY